MIWTEQINSIQAKIGKYEKLDLFHQNKTFLKKLFLDLQIMDDELQSPTACTGLPITEHNRNNIWMLKTF